MRLMRKPGPKSEIVFETPWFQVASRPQAGADRPHYVIHSPDFVAVIATNADGQLLLVRQFRPAVGAVTLELPSGHIESGETPEQAARRELNEETGHAADAFELLGELSPAAGRFTNRLWCFYAGNARPDPGAVPEPGVEPVLHRDGLAALLKKKEFCSSQSYGALCLAILRGKLKPA